MEIIRMSNEHAKSETLDKLVKEKGNKTEALLYLFSLPPSKYLYKFAEGLQQKDFYNYLVSSHYNNICGIPTCSYEIPDEYKNKYEENLSRYYNLKDTLYFITEGKEITEFKFGGSSDVGLNFALVDRELINKIIQDISKEEILVKLINHRIRSIFYSEFASSFFLFNYSISAKVQCLELLDNKSSTLFCDIVQQEINQRVNKYIAPINVKISRPLLNLLQAGLVYLENEDDELEAERFRTFGGTKIELLHKSNTESEKIKDIFDGQKIYVKSSNMHQNAFKSNLESKKFWN
jgi:hypothetical protein